MVCPVWQGVDNLGRRVCADSYFTKRAGCNSSEDRVLVENAQRPQYFEFINLNAGGLDVGYGPNDAPESVYDYARGGIPTNEAQRDIYNYTGNFGLDFNASVEPGCASYPYERGLAGGAQGNRTEQYSREGYKNSRNKCCGGF